MNTKLVFTTCAAALLADTAMAKDIEMQSIFPQTLPLLGKPAWDIAERVATLTADGVTFDVKNPGEIVATGRSLGCGVNRSGRGIVVFHRICRRCRSFGPLVHDLPVRTGHQGIRGLVVLWRRTGNVV